MFFDSIDDIPTIAKRVGTSVFIIPRDQKINLPGAILLQPEEKTTISIDQVRAVSAKTNTKQLEDLIILIRPAELLQDAAANALLKTLEQPGDRVHFVLVTDQPAALLPTILSRASVYVLRPSGDITGPISGKDQHKDWAKQLLVAKGQDLVDLVQTITKQKDNVKQRTLEVLRIAIEMAYKTYFLTKKPAFLQKLTQLIKAYEEIADGGNIKLQIVANLC